MVQLKRVLRYSKGTNDIAAHLSSTPGGLVAFSDADWAGDLLDRKSTMGVVVKIGYNTVFWRSQKQKSVALSSTEPNSLP